MSDGMFKGVVKKVGPVESFGEKGFKKRLLLVENQDGKYPNVVQFEITGDALKGTIPDEGDRVSVDFWLRGREWQDKHFTNLNVALIEIERPAVDQAPPVEKPTEEQDNIPF